MHKTKLLPRTYYPTARRKGNFYTVKSNQQPDLTRRWYAATNNIMNHIIISALLLFIICLTIVETILNDSMGEVLVGASPSRAGGISSHLGCTH